MDYEFNILYYVNVYKKWWKKIILIVVISMLLTACFSSRTSIAYISTVTLLSTAGGGLEGSVGSLGKFLGLSGLSESSSTDVIVALLNSRRMTKDISDRFDLDKKLRFRYKINTAETKGIFVIKVSGNDPVLIQKIANFTVENLDKINMELDITPNKPMVKVLDPAVRGIRQSRKILRKMLIAGILSFLFLSLYAFFSDYTKKLKLQ